MTFFGWSARLEVCPEVGAVSTFMTGNKETVIFQNPMKLTHLLMETVMSIYKANGFDSRRAYLTSIAEAYGVQVSAVFLLSQMLGAEEDFDGLISHLDDLSFNKDFEAQ